MQSLKINLAEKTEETVEKIKEGAEEKIEDLGGIIKRPRKKKFYKRFPFYLMIVILLLVGTFTYKIVTSGESIAATFKKIPIFNQLGELTKMDKKLLGEEHDRINILLLGMGGEGHDGAYLTDTIILVSLKPSTKQVAMLSLPRDLAVPIENQGWRKINAINAYAEMANGGEGGLATTEALSQLLNLPITYYARIDFEGFINVVDDFGGLDLFVENTLDDYQYPILGNENVFPISDRLEYLHIDSGEQHMDGSLALKYVRSRHSAGIEGSDFARSRRQQKAILAFKDKVFSWKTLIDPKRIKSLLRNYREHVDINLDTWEIIRLAEIIKDFGFKDINKINNFVLDDAPGGLLYATIAEDTGAYILLPRAGDYSEIQNLAENIFAVKPNKTLTAQTTAKKSTVEKTTPTKLEILNGTKVEGLAAKTKNDLENIGYKVVSIGNAPEQDENETIVYDLTNGKKSKTLRTLKSKIKARSTRKAPDWLTASEVSSLSQKVDFLVVLGSDPSSTN